jgi:cytidine deaminase
VTTAPPGTSLLDAARTALAAAGDSTISGTIAAGLIAEHGLASIDELALACLPVADEMPRPHISGFRVPAVGIESGTGALLFGANLEFPGTELTTTIHAEGFVTLRARRRGRGLVTVALPVAYSCAFCRQTFAEAAWSDSLVIIDAAGNRVPLADLYPHQFRPSDLGMPADWGRVAWPDLELFAPFEGPAAVRAALLEAGARAHAPYSASPSAVVLLLRDGRILSAGCVESVAFNPSISAMQAALVELAAARADGPEVVEAWLAMRAGGPVDPEPGFRSLLRAVAPAASARVVRWRGAG